MRSFVLRQGRMSPAQSRAIETLWPRYGIEHAPALIDFERTFGRRAPVVLEIGGQRLRLNANADPKHLERLAQLVNERFDTIHQSTRAIQR